MTLVIYVVCVCVYINTSWDINIFIINIEHVPEQRAHIETDRILIYLHILKISLERNIDDSPVLANGTVLVAAIYILIHDLKNIQIFSPLGVSSNLPLNALKFMLLIVMSCAWREKTEITDYVYVIYIFFFMTQLLPTFIHFGRFCQFYRSYQSMELHYQARNHYRMTCTTWKTSEWWLYTWPWDNRWQ